MSNHRTIDISLDHIVAEIVALPLVGQKAYKLGVEELDCRFNESACRRLWRFAEVDLLSKFPHTAIDELISLRNLLWFPSDTDPGHSHAESSSVSLGEFLRHVAGEFLVADGARARPRLPDGPGQRHQVSSGEAPDPAARRAWRWLTFALPADLLLAGLATDHSGPTFVEVVTDPVAALLDSGYAETHLHYGVAFDFSMGWAAAVNVAGRSGADRPGLRQNAFHSPGADHREGDDLAPALLRGVAVRWLLGKFLGAGRKNAQILRQGFQTWLTAFLDEDDLPADALSSDPRLWQQLISELAEGEIEFDRDSLVAKVRFLEVQSLYNRWAKLSTRLLPKSVAEVQGLDPLSDEFSVEAPPGPSVQLQFLWSGLAYLRDHPEDTRFSRLFWQCERIRCHTYRHCTQRPLVPGLTNFIRFYERKSILAGPIEAVLIEAAGLLGGLHRGLDSLEVRTSPCRNRDDQQVELQKLRHAFQSLRDRIDTAKSPTASPRPAQSPSRDSATSDSADDLNTTVGLAVATARSPQTFETGLVLHFLRIRGQRHDQGWPQLHDLGDFSDPRNHERNPRGYRWEGYFRDRKREANAIGNALALEPDLLEVVRGIDVCRDEPGVPIWVIAPLFRLVHDRVRQIHAQVLRESGRALPSLRTTIHVGEDFVHLASGLRAMDDAISFLPLRGGDRVGHGLALGVDSLNWARRTTRLPLPREERWFNLLWEWNWHRDRRGQFPSQRRNYLEHEIVRLAQAIFGKAPFRDSPTTRWTVDLALEFASTLHDVNTLDRLGYPDRDLPSQEPTDEVDQLIELYLSDGTIFHNARTVEWVESAHEGETLHELQRLVRQRYADLGITIEVNPISNLLVGDLTDLTSHPLWRLAPKWGDQFGPSLRMCVGSDDPFPFATNLREEYQFLYDSLILAGKSPPEARDWLDLVRQMGWESRFTR